MGSDIGANEGVDTSKIPILDWDSAAEEELRSIEESYAHSKRKISSYHLDLDAEEASNQNLSKGRQLPNWASSTADSRRRSWVLAPPPCRLNLKVKCQQMMFGGHIIYCRTRIEVEQAAMELFDKIKAKKQNDDRISLGFDIEWKPTFKQGEAPRKAALMQICMDTSCCYVIQIIYSGIPPILRDLLEDCSSVKVGVCIANDAIKILRDYDVTVKPLEDLSEYANLKLGGIPKRWSLSSLTEMLTCKELAKPPKIRMGNWEANPLSKQQLLYAATDAFASWYIHEVLKTFPDAKAENDDMKEVKDVLP